MSVNVQPTILGPTPKLDHTPENHLNLLHVQAARKRINGEYSDE
jgi:hypothetical protein